MAYITNRENGKTIKVSTGCLYEDTIGAQIKLREYIEELQRTGCRPKQLVKQTLSQQIMSFHDYQLAQKLTSKEANGNKMKISRICQLAAVGRVEEFTDMRVQMALAKLRCQIKSVNSRPEEMPLVSPRTRNTYLKALKTFINWLIRNNFITNNPLKSTRFESEEVDIRHQRTAFTDIEFIQLYNAAQNSHRVIEGLDGPTRALAYRLSAYTGLRKSELASLKAGSFHFGGGQAYLVVEAACSKRRRRDTIPLADHLIAEVQQALAKIEPGANLFPRLKTRKTHKMIKADLATTGLEYQSPDGSFRDWHALRHTFITLAWKTGASPLVVKTLARHTDLRLTVRYSHTTSRELQDTVNAIPNLLG